jgi:CAAX protease family protein
MTSIPPPEASPSRQPSPPEDDELRDDEPNWRIWMAPAAVVLGLVVGEVAIIFVNAIGSAAGSSFAHPTPAVTIIGNIVVDLSFVVAALYVVYLRGRPRASDFGFRPVSLRRGIAAFLLAGGGYYLVTAAYAGLFKLHKQDKLPSELGVSKSDAALIAAAVFVCVIAPMAEEFFFRGFLFGALRRWRVRAFGHELGTWLAAMVVGLLFGLVHIGSAPAEYLVPLGFLGFVLCLVRWRTRSLYPCMALHAFNNALALGVNELHWSAAGIIGLLIASLLAIGVATAPLARHSSAAPA